MAVPGETTCRAIGPVEPPTCGAGQVALPGETACHDVVADCGAAPWGAIPVDATTQYVDQSYAGGASDGSVAKPWTKIQAGVDAAASGAIVAVAAGTYAENVNATKAVRIWGRCPKLVAITSTSGAALSTSASGTELHTIAASGDVGVRVASSASITIDQVWLHGLAGAAVTADGAVTVRRSLVESACGLKLTGTPSKIDSTIVRGTCDPGLWLSGSSASTVSASVIEDASGVGILMTSTSLEVDGTVIRTIAADGSGFAAGIAAVPASGHGTVNVRRSLLRRNGAAGIWSKLVDLTVTDTRIADTTATGVRHDLFSGGIVGVTDNTVSPGTTTTVTIKGSLLERNWPVGVVMYGGPLDIEASVVRDTPVAPPNSAVGAGIGIECGVEGKAPQLTPARLTMKGSLVERNAYTAIGLFDGASGSIESSAIRDTRPSGVAPYERGYGVWLSFESNNPQAKVLRGSLAIRGSVLSHNRRGGVVTGGGDTTIESTTIRATEPVATGPGMGVYVGSWVGVHATLALRASLVDGNTQAGVYVDGADASILATLVRGTLATMDGGFGDALVARTDSTVGNATVSAAHSRFEGSARAGASAFGASVSLDATAFVCNAIQLDGESSDTMQAYGFDFVSRGTCACGKDAPPCQVLSSSLTPPAPLPATR